LHDDEPDRCAEHGNAVDAIPLINLDQGSTWASWHNLPTDAVLDMTVYAAEHQDLDTTETEHYVTETVERAKARAERDVALTLRYVERSHEAHRERWLQEHRRAIA